MRKNLFSIPIFEDEVDLTKIKFTADEYLPSWDSGTLTSLGCS